MNRLGDFLIPLLPVIGEKIIHLLDALAECLAPVPHIVEKSDRQILADAARADVGGVHASAGNALGKFEQLLSLLEKPEIGSHSADVEAMATGRGRKESEGREERME